jgi:hypothetical protein
MERTPLARWDDICVICITLAIRKGDLLNPEGATSRVLKQMDNGCARKKRDYPYDHRLEKESLTYGP